MSEKILVVDDSNMIRNITTRILTEANYTVITAVNGLEALELIKLESPALVLSDINMPEMDGITLTNRVKTTSEFKNFSHIPFIMLTTETDPYLEEEAKKAGALAWMKKPYQPEKLVALIQKVLEHSNK